MAIDELTDEELFNAYQSNSQIKDLVDGIQRKHHVHSSQKGQPDYSEDNIPNATREAKEAVSRLINSQNNVHSEAGHHNEEKHGMFSFPRLTQQGAAFGLAALVLALAALSTFGAAAPMAAVGYKAATAASAYAASAYTAPMYAL